MPFNVYDLLCKVFGSKDVIRLRRKLYTSAEIFINSKEYRIIPSGSRAEGVESEGSDYDIMILWKNIRVYESTFCIDPSDDCLNVIMDTENTKPGFTRLKFLNVERISDMSKHFQSILKNNFLRNKEGNEYISSCLIRDYEMPIDTIIHGPCRMLKTELIESEGLICFRCHEWISSVQPWIRRPRKTWPTKALVTEVSRFGVLFVPVGCKTSKHEDIEWRISFSIAEKQLIHSFTHVQFLCYAMLKTILSDVIKTLHGELLCSYFMKTIMFWLSEETEIEFWTTDNITSCYGACLKRLIYCLQYQVCLHYFLPEINFFEDRFNESEHKVLLSTLNEICRRGWKETLLYTSTFLEFTTRHNQHSLLSSSTVAPLIVIETLLKSMIEIQYPIHIRRFRLNPLKMTRIMIYIMAMNSYVFLTEYKSINLNCGNKKLYHQYKAILPDILISTKINCVSGWCMLALLFLKLKQYYRCMFIVNNCLRKCTPEKIWLDLNTYNCAPEDVQKLLSTERFISKIIQHLFVDAVSYNSASFHPTELKTIFANEDEEVCIPPIVYLLFLEFLCKHHLKQGQAKKKTFQKLQNSIRNEYFITNDHLMNTAIKILKIASQMMHIH